MPYADKEKQKAYVRDWTREYHRRKKTEQEKNQKELLENYKEAVTKLTNLRNQKSFDPFSEMLSQAHTTAILSGGKPVSFDELSPRIKQIFTIGKQKVRK
ncbi:hypothetical protein ACFLRN_02845 [Thermoproteota archaeon]